MATALATAFVRIRPVTTGFGSDLKKELDSEAGAASSSGAKAGESFASGMKSKVTKVANIMSAAMIGGAAVAGVAAVDMAAKFQDGLDLLVTGAGESAKNLKLVGNGIKSIAVTTGTTTTQLLSGMYMIESAGYHGAAGLKLLTAAAEGAKVGGADLGDVANALTSAMNAYHLPASRAVAVTNELVETTASGKMHMEDLARAMGQVLPIAASAGISFAQVGGAMATMTMQGMTARRASMNLANLIRGLVAPGAAASAEMKVLGLNANSLSRNVGKAGLTGTLDEMTAAILRNSKGGMIMASGFKSMTAPAKALAMQILAGTISSAGLTTAIGKLNPVQAALVTNFDKSATSATGLKQTFDGAMKTMVGGATGLNVALLLGGKNAGVFDKNVSAIAGSAAKAGKNVQGWGVITHEFSFQLDQVKEMFETIMITVGQKLIPVLESALRFFLAWKAPILIVAGLIGALALTISAVSYAMKAWAVATAVWGAITDSTLLGTVIPAWIMYTFGVESAGAATAIATGGMILVLAALVVGIVEVVKHWRDFKQWGTDALTAVEHAAEDTWHWIKSNWPLLAAVLLGPVAVAALEIVKHWTTIKDAAIDVWDWLKGSWQDVQAFLTKPILAFWSWITGFWQRELAGWKTLIAGIRGAFSNSVAWLEQAGENLILGLWNGAVKIAETAGAWVRKIGTIILNAFKNFFGIHSPSSVFMAIGENLIDALGRGMLGGAKGLAKWALSGLKNLGGSLLHDVLGFLGFGGGTGGGVAGTPSGATAAANARMAQTMGGAWGSGSEWTAWNNVAMRESGWNQYALNASSGAYGIPQALPPTKMPGAAQASGGSDPGSQIGWMMSYIKSAYGDPIGAWAHELSAGWYDRGGLLPTGLSLALNTTGRPEPVGHGLGSGVEARLDAVCGLLTQLIGVTAGTPAGTAAALNGIARGAGARALYPTRMGGSR